MSIQNRRILISGASGFIGRALCEYLTRCGYHLSVLRRTLCGKRLEWDPEHGIINPLDLEGFRAVIHLSGESIFGCWTYARQRKILESRVESTKLLAQTLASLVYKPEVFICASATGYYGTKTAADTTEDSPFGNDFFSNVCLHWEAAAKPAKDAGIRTVHLRQGVVLSKQSGLLAEICPWFQRGWGVKIGNGRQHFSWIGMDDLCAIYAHVIAEKTFSGPINAVAPAPATNTQFTRALAQALHTAPRLSIPSPLVRLFFGKAGKTLLLSDQQVLPTKLRTTNFSYLTPTLESVFEREFKNGIFR